MQNGQAHRVDINAQGDAMVNSGIHFLRVTASQGALTGQNYELIIRTVLPNPTNVAITSMSGPDFSPGLNYGFGVMPRVRASRPLTINCTATRNGTPVANARLNIQIFNFGWDNWNQSLFEQNVEVHTDANGNFTTVINLHVGRGGFRFWSGVSTHFFDLGVIRISSPTSGAEQQIPVYILAYTA